MNVELLGGKERENDVKCWKKKKCVSSVETIVNGLRILLFKRFSLVGGIPRKSCQAKV